VSEPFGDFYRGRRVLVTGHTGFKGAWLSIWLHRLGAHVLGYSLAPPEDRRSLFTDADVEGLLARHVVADIRDRRALKTELAEFRPDVVLHLAAQPLVLESYRDPAETFDVNVMGTVAMLEAVRGYDGEVSVVMITTDKVYENRNWSYGYREDDPLGGRADPYSASKAAMEIAVDSWRHSFARREGLPPLHIATARAGNVIGGGDWAANRLVPDIVRAAQVDDSVALRHSSATRPWQHVLEPLSGYLHLGMLLSSSAEVDPETAWNFGPSSRDARSVLDLAHALTDGLGSKPPVRGPSSALHEAERLSLSIDKAIQQLGWHPTWDFATTVGRTANWYRTVALDHGDSMSACLVDIEDYVRDAATARARWAVS
jgi:CDP-glucose 4,6-dehydratase